LKVTGTLLEVPVTHDFIAAPARAALTVPAKHSTERHCRLPQCTAIRNITTHNYMFHFLDDCAHHWLPGEDRQLHFVNIAQDLYTSHKRKPHTISAITIKECKR